MTRPTMTCPKCGTPMNHQAEKLVQAATEEEAAAQSHALDGLVVLVFACPGLRLDRRAHRGRRAGRVGVGTSPMRLLDPRLLRRARAARTLLVVDAALGVVMALLVLAQAVLLARVAARSFEGASLAEVATPLVLLVAVVAARALARMGLRGRG